MLPEAAAAWAPFIGLLAVIGIIYGALGCLAQTDMKRLIAFSSVAHMGFVMLGIATLTDFGINAAIFGMVAHGLITGMLFFIAGFGEGALPHPGHEPPGGLLVSAPRMGWMLGFCAMASLGLPGLAGFWGEFPAILASRTTRPTSSPRKPSAATWSWPRSALCSPPATCCGCSRSTAMGTPKEEFADDPRDHRRTKATEWVAWAPMLGPHPVLRPLPAADLPRSPTTRWTKSLVVEGLAAADGNCLEDDGDDGEACFDDLREAVRKTRRRGGLMMLLAIASQVDRANSRSPAPSTGTPSRPSSSLLERRRPVDADRHHLFSTRPKGSPRLARRYRPAGRRSSPSSPLPIDGDRPDHVQRHLRGRRVRPDVQGAVHRCPPTWSCCCPATTSPRATTGRTSTTAC